MRLYFDMNRTIGDRRIAPKVALVATALVLWGGLVLLFAAPLPLTGRIAWPDAVSFGGSFWALWLIFLPAVAWLSFRFPIERKQLFRNIALHLFACLLIVATNRATFRTVARIFPFPQASETHSSSSAAPSPPPPAGIVPFSQSSEAPGQPPDMKADTTKPQSQRRRRPALPPRRSLDLLGPPSSLGVFLGLRAALDVLVYWSLFGVCQAVTNFRSSQQRERHAAELEARLASAQLQALRMQINPHFLFNTLNSIAALVYVNPRAADEMLGDLSELLRRSLDSMEEQEIPLARELEFVAAYVRIEQKRFGERLQVEQCVPEGLMKALVPALILQPLVENAIRHGIEPQRAPGLISITAKQAHNRLHLSVVDNGRGLPGTDSNSPPRRSIGLANTQARLQGLYGQDQSFSFATAGLHGCRVEIQIPFHLKPVAVSTVSNQPAA
jgi:signal transduction histidine kinase